MFFSEILQSLRPDSGSWTADIPEDWMQGRSAFGGLQAAFAVRAMRTLLPDGLPLRTLQTTFMAPVPAGPVRIRAQVLRTGKNAVHVQAQLFDGDQVLCIVIGIFGAARASAVVVQPKPRPVAEPVSIVLPFVPGLMPSFTQHFLFRWLQGSPPFTGNPLTEHVIEVGLRDPGPVSEAHVIAMADSIPPLALSLLKRPAAGSSMTWTLELLAERFDHLALQAWRLDSELVAGGGGYTSQSVRVWGPGGEPLAVSRQSMVVFA